MSHGEQQPAQPSQQPETMSAAPATPLPVIGDNQWNKDITGILTSNANNAIAELGFNPNVLRALKAADSDITRLKAEKKVLENKNRDLSAHLALANNRIDFSKHDAHAMWKEVIYYREKYHALQRQHQEALRAHSTCATGPPEQPYSHLLQELEKMQEMYRHILGQNTTLKFEVQRLMQQCVNAGLIPPPQNYTVTPLPALQPPARRASEPVAISHQQPIQTPVQYTQGAQPGQVAREFGLPPSNPYASNLPVANNPTIVAGPMQAYNYHRAQFPQAQQVAAQLMLPPQQQPQQQALPQQGQQSVPQQRIPAIRPPPIIDLTNSNDERVPKRPRMASDPNVYTRHSPGSTNRLQHQVHAQMPAQTPYQILQQRTAQSRSQVAPTDRTQDRPLQQYHPYQYTPPATSPTYARPYGTNTFPNVPSPPTSISAPPVMDAYRTVTDEQGATPAQGQIQGNGQPQQVHTDPARPTNLAESPTERFTGTPPGSTPTAPPPDSVSVSPQVITNGQMRGGEFSLPPLTEEQIKQMRSELADSMFTEPNEGDERQARTCVFCDHRRELGILAVPLQPLLKPTTEDMYSHVQAQHPESLEVAERDWKMELFGMGSFKNQHQ